MGAARDLWPSAIQADENQLKSNKELRDKMESVRHFTTILLTYMGNSSDTTTKALAGASIKSVGEICDQLNILLDANKWHQETFEDYFGRLLDDTESIPESGWVGYQAGSGPLRYRVASMNLAFRGSYFFRKPIITEMFIPQKGKEKRH